MKTVLFAAGLSAFAFLSACASATPPVVLASVGPDTPTPVADHASGNLRVYSGYDPNTSGADDTKPFQNAAYEIRTDSGALVETVPNTYGTRPGDKPTTIALAAGSYRITAWSPQRGLVIVPVTIGGGRLTSVHLETSKG